jgi:uncharacterized protein YegL
MTTSDAGTTMMPGGGVARRPLHLIILADCSGGMDGKKMDSLNFAMIQMLQNLEDWDRSELDADLTFRILRFATNPEWLIEDPTPIADFRTHWRDIEVVPRGWTNMGAAFREVARALAPDRLEQRALRPAIVLVTDGLPTDEPGEFDEGLGELMSVPAGRAAFRAAIAIGDDANSEYLERFIGDPSVPVLVAERSDSLVDFLVVVSIALSRGSEAGTSRAAIVNRIVQAADDDEPLL